MPLDDLELLLSKLQEIIGTKLPRGERKVKAVNYQAKSNLFNQKNRELITKKPSKLKDWQQISQIQLPESQLLLRTIIDNLPWSLAILDRQMCYLAVSDRWIKDYELESTEVIGRTHGEMFPEIFARYQDDYHDCLTGKLGLFGSEDFWVRNGRRDWLSWQLRPWQDSKGEIGGLLIFGEITTEKKLLQQKIESTESQMRAVFAGINELVFTVESGSNSVLFLPTKFFELYDETIVNQIITQIQSQIFNAETDFATSVRRALETNSNVDFEYSLQLGESSIWLSFNVSAISETTVISIARDVTSYKEAEQDLLFVKNELAQVTLRSIGDAIIITDESDRVDYLNPVAEQLTGWRNQEACRQFLSQVFQIIDEASRRAIANPLDRISRINRVERLSGQNVLLARDGREYAIEGLASPLKNRQGKAIGTAIVFRDVTSARNMARQISWQANHDSLTELYNRHKFKDYVTAAIEDARNKNSHHVLCSLDLDRFKIVNDSCGHAAGDRLLQQIASLLQKRIRDSDIFARVGGDEFSLLLRHCPIDVAQNVVEQLRQSVEDFRFVCQGKVFRIGVSIGLVEIKPTVWDLQSLLSNADAACYAAKQSGGNSVHLYHEADAIVAQQRGERRWIEKLDRALEENRFCLYVQKIVAVDKSHDETVLAIDDLSHAAPENIPAASHYEVLLRLEDESGLVAPDVFLPAAERYGLMPAIDRHVITTFLAGYEVYCQTRQLPPSSPTYAINLSGASINSSAFADFLQEQFARFEIPPATICFEITETVAITNLDKAIALIEQLKELGCSIALDDFGSGMSSLTYLRNLPIDYLKIDGSFVTNIARDKIDYATLECFNHLSQIMNIKTVAEFVENNAILKSLEKIGIDYAQGYGIERPRPLVWG